ncbi:hypothetical protein [uncultured Ramlibacter sp.]|uniref:hypothetical protein n=1 Tax=uncultured Ramlibacter sp. TaxID=260755 RepID=UPI00262989A0|nr:hypothetical protein [uncultured Ramlibacter sp.]
MLLQRTEKARGELQPGVRTLGLRERSMLLLTDGRKSLLDLKPMFGGEGEQMLLKLVQQGYLEPVKPGFNPGSTGTFALRTVAFQAITPQAAAIASAPAPSPLPAPVASAAADAFEGKRSMATTRMFLFDICERMFARRNPALAEQFREALRNAKDRESMLGAARAMISEIERAAGPERADSISERIAMLLPAEAT